MINKMTIGFAGTALPVHGTVRNWAELGLTSAPAAAVGTYVDALVDPQSAGRNGSPPRGEPR